MSACSRALTRTVHLGGERNSTSSSPLSAIWRSISCSGGGFTRATPPLAACARAIAGKAPSLRLARLRKGRWWDVAASLGRPAGDRVVDQKRRHHRRERKLPEVVALLMIPLVMTSLHTMLPPFVPA